MANGVYHLTVYDTIRLLDIERAYRNSDNVEKTHEEQKKIYHRWYIRTLLTAPEYELCMAFNDYVLSSIVSNSSPRETIDMAYEFKLEYFGRGGWVLD